MKALSIRQPWAWLITNGIKTVENRTWSTSYRGRFFVHAGKQFDLTQEEYEILRDELQKGIDEEPEFLGLQFPEKPEDFETGGIVGEVELIDCVDFCQDEYDRIWHNKKDFAFILRNPKVLPFQKMPGKLNFFDIKPKFHKISHLSG